MTDPNEERWLFEGFVVGTVFIIAIFTAILWK